MRLSELVNENKVNFIIYGIGQAFNLVSPIIIAPYIISVCGIDSFGKVGLGFALSLFLILIVDYAFDIKGTQKVAENRHNTKILQSLLFETLYTKGVLMLIAFFVAFLLINLIPLFSAEKPLFFLSFIVVFAQVFNPIWFLQGLEDFKTSSIINILSKSTYVLLVYCFINQNNDYIFVNAFLGTSLLIFNIIGLLIIKKRYKFNLLLPNIKNIKYTLKKDFTFCMSQLFLSLRQLSPLFLTSYFFGFNLAGQYKLIEQIISFFRTLTQVYLKYFFPRLCYIISLSTSQAIDFWKRYKIILLLGVFVLVTTIYCFSNQILTYFNVPINQSKELSKVMKVSLVIPLLMVFSLSLEQLMFAFNRNSKYIQITIFVTIINIILLLILMPIFDLYGVLFSIIFSELFFSILYYRNASFIHKQNKH